MSKKPRPPLSIAPYTVIGGRCPFCGAPATEIYDMACRCCDFKEQCCRACASPPALRALAEVLVYRERMEQRAGALIERESWEEPPCP